MNIDVTTALALKASMQDFATEMDEMNTYSKIIAKRTLVIVSITLLFAILCSGYLILLVNKLNDDMRHLAGNMVQMYQHFGDMAEDVEEISYYVKNIGDKIVTIPRISKSMTLMSNDLAGITGNIRLIEGSVTTMDSNMGNISVNMKDMTQRFGRMTQNVEYMRKNINEMAKPMRGMNLFTP